MIARNYRQLLISFFLLIAGGVWLATPVAATTASSRAGGPLSWLSRANSGPSYSWISGQVVDAGVYTDTANFMNWWNSVADVSITNASATVSSWQFGSTLGDPTISQDNYLHAITDARAYIYLRNTGQEIPVGVGGSFTQPPTIDPVTRSGSYIWSPDLPGDNATDITVTFKFQLVRDVAHWSYQLTNTSGNTQYVGLRVAENVQFPLNEGVDPASAARVQEAPYYFPFQPPVTVVKEMVGGAVPTEWWAQYPVAPGVDLNYQPYWKFRQLFSGNATPPARLVIASWNSVTSYGWPDVDDPANNAGLPPKIQPNTELGTDTGVDLFYTISPLLSGGNNTYTVKGEMQLATDAVQALHRTDGSLGSNALAVYAPNWISLRNGAYSPAEIPIRAYIANASTATGPTVNVTISVGKGLVLEQGSQNVAYNFQMDSRVYDSLCQQASNGYSWKLTPDGSAGGLIPVSVTATFAPGGTVTSTIYVNVPVKPQLQLSSGTYYLGFPYQFSNADPNTALGLGTAAEVAFYDATAGTYRYSDKDTIALTPGVGYWVKLNSPALVSLRSATALDQTKDYSVNLSPGWNAVSVPFLYGVTWGSCYFYLGSDQYTLQDAVNKGYIRAELWSWDATNNAYNPPQGTITDMLGLAVQPNTGYWVYATRASTLDFVADPVTPDVTLPPSRAAKRGAGSANDWQVNILADAGGAKDRLTTFGMSTHTTDGTVAATIMAPPAGIGGVAASFLSEGRAPGNLAVDLRAQGAPLLWKMDVNCATPKTQVTLRWPDLTQVPGQLAVVLTDTQSGQQINMRTCPNYTFNNGDGATRHFTINVQARSGRLCFTQADAVRISSSSRGPSGVRFTYGVSAPAQVTISVRTLTGRLVRVLAPTASRSGLSTAVWDGTDVAGRQAPSGIYLTEFLAVGDDQSAIRSTVVVHK